MFRLRRPRVLTTALVAGTAAGAVLALAPDASAGSLPAPTLSKATVQRGEPFTISGTGCFVPGYDPYTEGRHSYVVSVGSGEFAGSTEAAESDGSWSLTMEVGSHLGPGSYAIRASCSTGTSGWVAYPTITVTVVGEPLPPPWWTVPVTPQPGPPPGPSTGSRTTAPRSTSPSNSTRATTPAGPPPAVASAPASTTAPTPTPAAAAVTPTAAPGCRDCVKLAGTQPIHLGEQLALRYAGFQPGEPVTVVLHSTPVPLGTFSADTSGVVGMTVTIPASTEAGAHTITLSGPVTGDRAISFRLAAQQTARAAAGPPAEAGDPTLPAVLGGAVVLLGAGGVVWWRRRAARTATG